MQNYSAVLHYSTFYFLAIGNFINPKRLAVVYFLGFLFDKFPVRLGKTISGIMGKHDYRKI